MAIDNIITMSTIDSAPIIEIGGEKIVDLLKRTFKRGINKKGQKSIMVDDSLDGNPDLISRVVYSSTNFIDLLFSYNGYSNPLTVRSGDKIVVPTISDLQSVFEKSSGNSTNNSIEQLGKRIPKIDKKRFEFLKQRNNNNSKLKTPNQNESKKQYTIDKQTKTIFLGSPDSSVSAVNDFINKIKTKTNG